MRFIAQSRITKALAGINCLLVFAGLVAILGCEHDVGVNQVLRLAANDETEYRIIAWNDLSERERATVIGDRNSGRVKRDRWREKDVIAVTFNTTEDALLGPIILYIDPQTKKVVGRMGRF